MVKSKELPGPFLCFALAGLDFVVKNWDMFFLVFFFFFFFSTDLAYSGCVAFYW